MENNSNAETYALTRSGYAPGRSRSHVHPADQDVHDSARSGDLANCGGRAFSGVAASLRLPERGMPWTVRSRAFRRSGYCSTGCGSLLS